MKGIIGAYVHAFLCSDCIRKVTERRGAGLVSHYVSTTRAGEFDCVRCDRHVINEPHKVIAERLRNDA